MSFPAIIDSALGAVCATLGESVSYTPQGGSPVTIDGIYSDRAYDIDPGGGAKVATKKSLLEIQLSALAAPPKAQDTVVVRGATYIVTDSQPDGAGATTLHLQKQ